MQLVVVMAVRKAVRAATITFTATSIKRFFILFTFLLFYLFTFTHRLLPGHHRHRCCHRRYCHRRLV